MSIYTMCPLCNRRLHSAKLQFHFAVVCSPECPFRGPSGETSKEALENWRRVVDAVRASTDVEDEQQPSSHIVRVSSIIHNDGTRGDIVPFVVSANNAHIIICFEYDNSTEYTLSFDEFRDILERVVRGKIDAIRSMRTSTGGGLTDCKHFVDSLLIQGQFSEVASAILDRIDIEENGPVSRCAKCEHRLNDEEGAVNGCKLTRYAKNGENCPLKQKEVVT